MGRDLASLKELYGNESRTSENGWYLFYTQHGNSCRIKFKNTIIKGKETRILISKSAIGEGFVESVVPNRIFVDGEVEVVNYLLKHLTSDGYSFEITGLDY